MSTTGNGWPMRMPSRTFWIKSLRRRETIQRQEHPDDAYSVRRVSSVRSTRKYAVRGWLALRDAEPATRSNRVAGDHEFAECGRCQIDVTLAVTQGNAQVTR